MTTDYDLESSSSEESSEISDVSVGDFVYRGNSLSLVDIMKIEIESGDYSCLICTGEITPLSRIWSCGTCYRAYDLDCIKGWSERGIETSVTAKEWKCPSCNSAQTSTISEYRCWCGKVVDPLPNKLMPHSCGQTCGEPLSCIHECPETCHPGPHSECTAMGPSLYCECGSKARQLPCIITNYNGWKCDSLCDELLPCGEHRCTRSCHSGLCGPCTVKVVSKCYCGKTNMDLPCNQRRLALSQKLDGKVEWIGSFRCESSCDEFYDCGVHKCSRGCHPAVLEDNSCPRMPLKGELCQCGQSSVYDILSRERLSCEEEIPVCDKICSRLLACGHHCKSNCHSGPCPSCLDIVTSSCRCSSQVFDVPCAFIQAGQKVTCTRACSALLSCRKHRCKKICCEFEKKAWKRENKRKRMLRTNTLIEDSEEIEEVHICKAPCNGVLNCGIHNCTTSCHRGPCSACLESVDENYVCPCGNTIVLAPIRCGAPVPKCDFPCHRIPSCGHPPVMHSCHDDNVECPKCPKIGSRECVCGKKIIKGVSCSQKIVSCGTICGESLKCGHSCQKICHTEGECDIICKSLCNKTLSCGHQHKSKCHYPNKCSDDFKCSVMVKLRCRCGFLKKELTCADKEDLGIDLLDCDESCAVNERSKQLADAFGMTLNLGENDQSFTYSDDLVDIYLTSPSWSDSIQQILDEFLSSSQSSLRLRPMNSLKRMFVHLLAEAYQLTSESYDSEPYRSVVVYRKLNAERPKISLNQYCISQLNIKV